MYTTLRRFFILLPMLALFLAPLAGGLLRGLPVAFLEFPPRTQYIPHAPFAPTVFAFFAALTVGTLCLLIQPRWFGFRQTTSSSLVTRHSSFPAWFWLGVALNVISWVGAWGRFTWLGEFKDHTFFPLWFGFILAMDGLVCRRTGTSLLRRSPFTFFILFPISAVAWWYFEYLNRFVQNWWYEGAAQFSALHYVFFATLSFSTVLPAVFEMQTLLASFRWFQEAYSRGPTWKPWPRPLLAAVPLAGIVGLILLARLPNPLFFTLWLSPLAILAGSLALAGVETPFSDLKKGNYSALFSLGVAALACGFFWEMWNYFSLPKWHYAVPYVCIAKIFEMPISGYGGYLPFGPICWCFWLAAKELLGLKKEDMDRPK